MMVLGFGLAARALVGGTSGSIPTAGGTSGGSSELPNPLPSDTFAGLIAGIVDWMINIGSMIAVAMIIYSGFLFMTAGGSDTKVTAAKKSLIWSLVGLGILLMSKGLVLVVQDLLSGTIIKMLI